MTKSRKKIALITAAILVFVTVVSVIIPSSLAYFRALFDKNGSHGMVIELIFDRLDEEGMEAYAEKYEQTYGSTFSPSADAEWGTIDNPYVISQKYHVQNLSVLQNVGFFEKRVD